MKYAVLSMDIEEWYHLDYFDRASCDQSISLLDGVNVYRALLDYHKIPSSFFVLGELIRPMQNVLKGLIKEGYDIGVHGWAHTRPLTMSPNNFLDDLLRTKNTIEDTLGISVQGYRAPCFSMNKELLEIVHKAGFKYDSSRILFSDHPLYGTIDMKDYKQLSLNIFRKDTFFEFQVSTLPLLGQNVPVSGGGYIRIFPWFIMQRFIQAYLSQNELYVLYIHPFELSPQPCPQLPIKTHKLSRLRFQLGRTTVYSKLSALVTLLKENHFCFTTFAALRDSLLSWDGGK